METICQNLKKSNVLVIFIVGIFFLSLSGCSDPQYSKLVPEPYTKARLGMSMNDFKKKFKEAEYLSQGEGSYGIYWVKDKVEKSRFFDVIEFYFDSKEGNLNAINLEQKYGVDDGAISKYLEDQGFEKENKSLDVNDRRFFHHYTAKDSKKYNNYVVSFASGSKVQIFIQK